MRSCLNRAGVMLQELYLNSIKHRHINIKINREIILTDLSNEGTVDIPGGKSTRDIYGALYLIKVETFAFSFHPTVIPLLIFYIFGSL